MRNSNIRDFLIFVNFCMYFRYPTTYKRWEGKWKEKYIFGSGGYGVPVRTSKRETANLKINEKRIGFNEL